MRKATIFGIACLILALAALPFMACAEPTPPAPPGAPTVITPTPAVVTPSPGLPPAPVAPAPALTTPAGPAAPVTPAPAPVVVPAPAGEPVFTVLDPRATEAAVEYVGLVPRLDTIDGKNILAINLHGGNETANRSIGPALQAQYPTCTVTSHESSDMWKMATPDMQWAVDNFDGAILAENYWGGAAARQALVVADLEKMGLPCVMISYDLPDLVIIAADAFMGAGIPACRQVEVTSDTAVNDLGPWIPAMVDALTRPLTAQEASSGTYQAPVPPRIAMAGTYDEITDYFTGYLVATPTGGPWAWMTAGLPIVPPTEEAVARMLTGTSHSPDEVLSWTGWGRVPREATIEKVAVNAVMAGCRPEYMPAVLAIAATNGCVGYPGDSSFGSMYVVSGPYAKEIGMNAGFCFLESGNPANMALEHACQLMGVNCGGCLQGLTNLQRTGNIHWGTTFAENPDTPWDTLNVDLGYDVDESVLLAWGGKVNLIPFQNIEVKNATSLEECQPGTPDHWIAALKTGTQQRGGILLFAPDTAQRYKDTWGFDSIQEIQDYVWENVTWKAGDWYNNYWFVTHRQRAGYEAKTDPRMLGKAHLDLPPDTQIPQFNSPEDVTVIVAGGSGDAWTWGFGTPRASSIDDWR